MELKQFIKIDNRIFKPEEGYFQKIGTEAFCIYSYIKIKQGQSTFIDLSMKQIKSFLASEKTTLKDTRTLEKYLINLIRNEFIIVDSNLVKDKIVGDKTVNKLDVKVGDFFTIKDNPDLFKTDKEKTGLFESDKEKKIGFTPLSTDLFANEIKHIGSNGWAIVCLLTNLFNANYGQMTCEGFANPSEGYIAKVLDIGLTTIKKYLKILEKRRLIKIEPQPAITIINKHSEEVTEYLPNHYIVKNRLMENKYYIDFNKAKKSA